MDASWNLEFVAAKFSAAALNPSLWKPALQCLSDTVGAVGTVLIPHTHRTELITTEALAETTQRYVKEGWHAHDIRYRGLPAMLRRGVMVDQDFASLDEIKRSEYYNDFLGRHDLRWFAAVPANTGDELLAAMSIQRSIRQGPFEPREQESLARLRGPLSTAATVSKELSLARARGLAEAIELAGSAAFIADRLGQVTRANRLAEKVLGTELWIDKRRLTALDHDVCKSIDRLINHTVAATQCLASFSPVVVRRVGRRPLVVYAVPLMGDAHEVFSAARALIIVLDLDSRPVPPTKHLRDVFRLTLAEAELVVRLAAGDGLDAIANQLEITKETVRTQLKAAFAKTDTSRQSELVAVVLQLLRSQPNAAKPDEQDP